MGKHKVGNYADEFEYTFHESSIFLTEAYNCLKSWLENPQINRTDPQPAQYEKRTQDVWKPFECNAKFVVNQTRNYPLFFLIHGRYEHILYHNTEYGYSQPMFYTFKDNKCIYSLLGNDNALYITQ